jgi:GT2 family glycosyltransferase
VAGNPEISVVVPTYRRPELLERCLSSLAEQTADRDQFEVVVVDDGSADETGQVLATWSARLPNVHAKELTKNRGPAAARNRGVAESSAPLLLFLDDDVVAPPTLVTEHLALHAGADPKLGVLGRVEWHPDLRVTSFMRWLDRSGLQFGFDALSEGVVDPPYVAFYTANLSMRRELFDEVGGFDERFPYPAYEDMELAWRLHPRGFRLEYRPAALAFHARPIELATFTCRTEWVAESAALLRRLHPDFPVDDTRAQHGWLRRRGRWSVRIQASLSVGERRRRLHDRYFQAEIAEAYRRGQQRAERAFSQRPA